MNYDHISLTDITFLIDNFRKYIKETDSKDILEFLKLRKTIYKKEIKEADLKNKLRIGLESHVKSPFKILKKIFSNEKCYNEFILSLNDDRKNKNIKKSESHSQTSSFWTDEEIVKLKSNYKIIIDKYNIEDPDDFLFNTSKENIKFKKNIKFSKLLLEGIPDRKPDSVCHKLKSIERKYNKRKWTEEEVEELMKLGKEFKHNWILVGKELNRLPNDCLDKYSGNVVSSGYSRNRGPWKKSECKRLRKAIRKLMNIPKYSFVIENISWIKVAQYVKTRSPHDCRLHWTYTFSCIKQDGVSSHFNDEIFLNFIKKIKKKQFKIWKLIDWKSLWLIYDNGQFTPSPAALLKMMRIYFNKIASINPKPGMKLKKLFKRLHIENNKKIHRKENS